MVSAAIVWILLSLGLAAMVRAAGPPAADQPAAGLSPTLLPSAEPAAFPAEELVPAPARGTQDPATSPVRFQAPAPAERVSSNSGDLPNALPSLVPLPLMGAQPAPAQTQAPVRAQQPAPPGPATREVPQNRPAQPPRPAAAGVQPQDIQFDANGLVDYFHVNEGDLRQILEMLSRAPR